MAFRKELVRAGDSLPEAIAVGGSTEIGVTVNKSVMMSQATAYQITNANTIVTTSDATPASGQNALILPVTEQGDWLQVANFTANSIYVWPPVGWGIHGLGQNVTYPLAAGKTASFTTVTDPVKSLPQGGLAFHQVLALQG